MTPAGKFVISLDFELYWGVRDKKTLTGYGANIENVWRVIPRMLELFEKFGISASFATVGFLFASNPEELLEFSPAIKPKYMEENLSPYTESFDQYNEDDYKYYFAYLLIQIIQNSSNHEIGTHTFSHYYCLEKGQNLSDFKEDLKAANLIAKSKNVQFKSIVFPRNQYNDSYIQACSAYGIDCYRGNENAWYYKPSSGNEEGLVKRALRLLDAYVNISGHNSYPLENICVKTPHNVASSRFLRPFSSRLKVIEPLKIRRIKKSMTHAAKNSEVFHLWWHPHNFGSNMDKNFKNLTDILDHYSYLKDMHNFKSITMSECSKQCNQDI